MAFEFSSPKLDAIKQKLIDFCLTEVAPGQKKWEDHLNAQPRGERFASIPPIIDELKAKAKKLGLWNLWMPKSYLPLGAGLSNLE
jgi:acyl-CoA dehydrogenase